jgi:hypothetical protein
MKLNNESISLKTKIEHISFQSDKTYMDVECREGFVDITIGGIENERFSVTLEEWHIINKKVIEILNQK